VTYFQNTFFVLFEPDMVSIGFWHNFTFYPQKMKLRVITFVIWQMWQITIFGRYCYSQQTQALNISKPMYRVYGTSKESQGQPVKKGCKSQRG